ARRGPTFCLWLAGRRGKCLEALPQRRGLTDEQSRRLLGHVAPRLELPHAGGVRLEPRSGVCELLARLGSAWKRVALCNAPGHIVDHGSEHTVRVLDEQVRGLFAEQHG